MLGRIQHAQPDGLHQYGSLMPLDYILATIASRWPSYMSVEPKEMVSGPVKAFNKEMGQGLSQYNTKVQDFADRVPGDFSKKVAKYPWVTITMSLAFGLLLGVLLKPSRV
jgi:ElaB/YqjD/DUF883 family membrane-anchored ribosome-binding protein